MFGSVRHKERAVEPVPLKRVFFWAFCVLGSLVFVCGLLLTQVPRPIHDEDFRLELVIWGSSFCFLLISLLFARRIPYVKTWDSEDPPTGAYGLFIVLCFLQLLFCLYALVSFLIYSIRPYPFHTVPALRVTSA